MPKDASGGFYVGAISRDSNSAANTHAAHTSWTSFALRQSCPWSWTAVATDFPDNNNAMKSVTNFSKPKELKHCVFGIAKCAVHCQQFDLKFGMHSWSERGKLKRSNT
jgi:hypothetical protein